MPIITFVMANKAMQIIRFAEMCRKLETEEEKILPFYTTSLTEKEEFEIKQALHENPGQELAEVCFSSARYPTNATYCICKPTNYFSVSDNERLFEFREFLEKIQ